MKVVWQGEHPDEGSIHAWLDGEIDADDAARLEAHVRTCAACTDAVAEARGLVAGASRVVGMLDDAPAPLIRPAVAAPKARAFRVTPMRSAIAAVLLVAIGITLTRKQGAFDSISPAANKVASEMAPAASLPPDDHLLDSAIGRRIASEQPPRSVQAAPGAAVAVPAAPPSPGARDLDESSAQRVAVGRASLRAQADTVGAPADRARADAAVSSVGGAALGRDVAAAATVERTMGKTLEAQAQTLANRCVRLESSTAGAMWGRDTLPIVLVFDATGRVGRVFSSSGQPTEQVSTVYRATADSVIVRLRSIGYIGTLAIAGSGDARPAIMQSGVSASLLSEVVTTATGEARSDRREAAKPPAQAPARANAPVVSAPLPTPRPEPRPGVPLQVMARMVSCPTG